MSFTDKQLRDASLVFYEDDVEAITSILDAFLKKSAAKCALLVDKDGHMISSRGDTANSDLDTISALVAGSFAATRALAHQFGEDEFTALFHQGKGGNIQLSLVADRALLTALFDDNTTIGMVRLYATEAAKRLTSLFIKKLRAGDSESAPLATNGDFSQESSGALDQMFGE